MTENRKIYEAAIATLPKCEHGWRPWECQTCKPRPVAKPDFRSLPIDEAKAALLKEMFK